MGKNLYKLIKKLMTSCHVDFMTSSNATAKNVEGVRGFWPNISKTVQLIFTKLMSFLVNHL